MNGVEHPNQTESLQEIQDSPINTKGDVLRGSRRGFIRLIGAAALATTVPAKAVDLSALGKQAVADWINRAGSEYGVSVRPSPSGNGKPDFNIDVNQAVRMAEQRKIAEQKAQAQAQRQRAYEEAMRSPTNISFDNDANMAFKQQGLDISQTDLRVFHPSNYEGGFFLTPNQTKKYTSVDISQPATNIFLISAAYVFKSGNQIGQIGRDVSRYRYHPNEKAFKEILLRQ